MALELDYYAQAAVPLEDGSFVSTEVVRVAEIIADFFPHLEVRWLPRDKRQPGDNAFQIIEKTKDGAEVVAFSVEREDQFNEELLQRIFEADVTKQKHGPQDILARIDARNAAIRIAKLKREAEQREEVHDLVVSVLKSPLNRYQHNGYRYDLPEHMQPKKVIL